MEKIYQNCISCYGAKNHSKFYCDQCEESPKKYFCKGIVKYAEKKRLDNFLA